MLFLAVCLLPFAAVPRELYPTGVSLAPIVFALFAVCALRHRPFNGGRLTGVEVVAILLAIWVGARLLVLAPLGGEQVAWGLLLREVGALWVGVVAFHLARRPALQLTILRGIGVAVAIMLAHETYQILVGIDSLMGFGYTTENGYHYATFTGEYRPFGTFSGPTTFGSFLAMLGIFYGLASRRTWVLVLVLAGVLATETRAAWLGAGLGLVVVALLSARVRHRLVTLVPLLALIGVATLLVIPRPFDSFADRLTSIADQGDTSRVTRLDLWGGVLDAVAEHSLLSGLGDSDWLLAMYPHVGSLAYLGHAHSNVMQEVYRYGLVGAALFVALVVALLRQPWRGRRIGLPYSAAAIAAVMVFAVDSLFNNSLSSLNVTVAVFLLAGMGSTPSSRDGDPGARNAGVQRRSRRAVSA